MGKLWNEVVRSHLRRRWRKARREHFGSAFRQQLSRHLTIRTMQLCAAHDRICTCFVRCTWAHGRLNPTGQASGSESWNCDSIVPFFTACVVCSIAVAVALIFTQYELCHCGWSWYLDTHERYGPLTNARGVLYLYDHQLIDSRSNIGTVQCTMQLTQW